MPLRLQNGIYLLAGIVQGLLGIRFVLALLGANPAAGFAQLVHKVDPSGICHFTTPEGYMSNNTQNAEDTVHDLKNDVKDAAHDLKNRTKDAAHDLKNDVKDAAHDAKNDAKDAARDADRRGGSAKK